MCTLFLLKHLYSFFHLNFVAFVSPHYFWKKKIWQDLSWFIFFHHNVFLYPLYVPVLFKACMKVLNRFIKDFLISFQFKFQFYSIYWWKKPQKNRHDSHGEYSGGHCYKTSVQIKQQLWLCQKTILYDTRRTRKKTNYKSFAISLLKIANHVHVKVEML